jgi:hypothetical protein
MLNALLKLQEDSGKLIRMETLSGLLEVNPTAMVDLTDVSGSRIHPLLNGLDTSFHQGRGQDPDWAFKIRASTCCTLIQCQARVLNFF